MTDITINQGMALELLTEAVKVKGADYIYQHAVDKGFGGTCVYTMNGEPSCIVGYALASAGVPLDVLSAIDWGGAVVLYNYDEVTGEYVEPYEETLDTGLEETSINDRDVLYWLRKNGVEIDQRALSLFSKVQCAQDDGTPWGKAVSDAITAVNRW